MAQQQFDNVIAAAKCSPGSDSGIACLLAASPAALLKVVANVDSVRQFNCVIISFLFFFFFLSLGATRLAKACQKRARRVSRTQSSFGLHTLRGVLSPVPRTRHQHRRQLFPRTQLKFTSLWQRVCHPAPAVRHALLRAHAYRMLIGACNPMPFPIPVFRAARPSGGAPWWTVCS